MIELLTPLATDAAGALLGTSEVDLNRYWCVCNE